MRSPSVGHSECTFVCTSPSHGNGPSPVCAGEGPFLGEPLIGIEPMTYSLRVNRSGRLS